MVLLCIALKNLLSTFIFKCTWEFFTEVCNCHPSIYLHYASNKMRRHFSFPRNQILTELGETSVSNYSHRSMDLLRKREWVQVQHGKSDCQSKSKYMWPIYNQTLTNITTAYQCHYLDCPWVLLSVLNSCHTTIFFLQAGHRSLHELHTAQTWHDIRPISLQILHKNPHRDMRPQKHKNIFLNQ